MAGNNPHRRKHRLGEATGWKCHYCGVVTVCTTCDGEDRKELARWASVDHINPQVLGGTWGPDNTVLACHSCNNKKGHAVLDADANLIDIEWVWQEIRERSQAHKRRRAMNNLIKSHGWNWELTSAE